MQNLTLLIIPLQAYDFPDVFVGISRMLPLKFLYQGSIGARSSSKRRRLKLATMSRGLKLGMNVLQPVPIPSAPFTSTMGITGIYLYKQTLHLEDSMCKFRERFVERWPKTSFDVGSLLKNLSFLSLLIWYIELDNSTHVGKKGCAWVSLVFTNELNDKRQHKPIQNAFFICHVECWQDGCCSGRSYREQALS